MFQRINTQPFREPPKLCADAWALSKCGSICYKCKIGTAKIVQYVCTNLHTVSLAAMVVRKAAAMLNSKFL